MLIIFSLWEIIPTTQKIKFGREKLPLGGALSGFFGGISGIQGAIRSAFLIKSGLSNEAYIATGVIIASLVDFSFFRCMLHDLLDQTYRIMHYCSFRQRSLPLQGLTFDAACSKRSLSDPFSC